MADTRTTHLDLIKQDANARPDITKEHSNLDTLDSEVWARGRAFNGTLVGEDGGFHVRTIPYAENLETSASQSSDDNFIIRTTGGDASLEDGDAWLTLIRGTRKHVGYSPESIDMTVTPMARPVPAAITAEINIETFIAYVGEAGTYTISYTTDWDTSPATYGITVTNTPVNGDSITVVWDGEDDPVMTVNAVDRPAPESITATLDRDTFVAYVATSGTTNLTYSTQWSANPALYGITVTGTPVAGDAISVVYVKEVRGTIVQSNPQTFVSTGWNLYDHTNGYAHVIKYSSDYGFKIAGTYSVLEFSPTVSGSRVTITPVSGYFTLPTGYNEGYLFVTGGTSTDTEIWMTWSDWGESANGGTFAAYTQDVINLATFMGDNFPYGLLQVGTYQDEINLNIGIATSYVARMAYTAENLASAKASGKTYEYDENYIYIVRDNPVTYMCSVDGDYVASDHGLEYFTGTSQAVYAQTLYGANLKNKLERDVVTISQQSLTSAQQEQVRANIGAISSDDIATQVITTGTLASVQTALVTLLSSMDVDQVVKVRFGITPASGKFTVSSYYGTLIKYSGTACMVDVLNLAGYSYYGYYNSGTWVWTSTNPAISLSDISNNLNNAKSESIVMYTNGEAANVTNAPYSNLGGYVIVHRLSDNEVIQTYYQRNTSGPIRVKTRLCLSGTWTMWREHEAVLELTSTQKLLTVADNDTLCPVGSTTVINLYGCDSSDLPSSSYKYGYATVEKYATHRIFVTVRSVVLSTSVATNRMQSDGTWGGWKIACNRSDILTYSFDLSSKTAAVGANMTWEVDVTKTGYTPLGIVHVDFTDNLVALNKYGIWGNTVYVTGHNETSGSVTTSGTIRVLYKLA